MRSSPDTSNLRSMLLKAKELIARADVLSEKGKLLIGFEQSWEMSRSKFWVIFSGIWAI